MSEETRLLEQAVDANATLDEEIKRLRRTVSMLRGINGMLRRANESLRRQAELAVQNDELFKQVCDSGFGAPVTAWTGGLPEHTAVDSTVANVEEASEATASS